MRVRVLVSMLMALLVPALAAAKPPPPTADLPGSKDSPLLGRYEGSIIVSYEHKAFREFELPLAALEKVPGRKDNHNNNYFGPKQKKVVSGAYTRWIYLIPPERSALEVSRNYADDVRSRGGKVLFQCRDNECGGDPKRGGSGGGGQMSLSMYLYPAETHTDNFQAPGGCLMRTRITDRNYFAAQLPKQGAHVSVYTFTVDPGACSKDLGNRTVALVQVVEDQAREDKMVAVDAGEMARSIASTGRVALYGIYFDSNQAEVKAESSATLEQIAKLMKDRPALQVLIVGHTDNAGEYAANLALSERRAKAVVDALSTRFGVAAKRMTPIGVSFASPLDSNKSEEGRAKNRRVEIVER